MDKLFKNRSEAAIQLAGLLSGYRYRNAMVLAIPRGGVPIGYTIAKELAIPLDIALYKNIGHPFHRDFAIGSVGINDSLIDSSFDIPEEYIKSETERLMKMLRERYESYRGNAKPVKIENKIAIITDDFLINAGTVLPTIRMVQKYGAAEIIMAVPVISTGAADILKDETDKIITLTQPRQFEEPTDVYQIFEQISNDEIVRLLKRAEFNFLK